MENLNESLQEPVCIEEEVFFGPIADKERKIKENFENVFVNENKTVEYLAAENDISKNDSLYTSFSVDESKYDSYDDSLNEEGKKPQEIKHITLKKSFDKVKSKKHSFYDSLEDVCSLVSNLDKCSISCEVENNSNLNNKQHIIEDSLKNPPVAVANKNICISEQVHFDDDSLAILELENTFDDSLEEVNDVCVSIEEIDEVEIMAAENQNIAINIEQNSACFPRNLFDTSVQVVYEKKWASDGADHEELSDDKNVLYDSLSNSDLKDILKDSLEESEECCENLKFLKPVSNVNTQKSEEMLAGQGILDASVQIIYDNFHIDNTSEMNNSEYNEISKDSLENCKNIDSDHIEQADAKTTNEHDSHSCSINAILSNGNIAAFQNSPENVSTDVCHIENISDMNEAGYEETSKHMFENCKNANKDPFLQDNEHDLYSSTINAILSSENTTEAKKKFENPIANECDNLLPSDSNANKNDKIMKDTSVISEPEYHSTNAILSNENITSFQKSPENVSTDVCHIKNISDMNKAGYQETSKHTLENCKNAYKDPLVQAKEQTTNEHDLYSSTVNSVLSNEKATEPKKKSQNPLANECDNLLHSDSNANKNDKIMKDTSVISEPVISVSAVDNSSCKETFTLDSCQLKLLNDDLHIDKDLKFQLHLEVTVGDKKCQIASQEIKWLPVTNENSEKYENNSTPGPIGCHSEDHVSEKRGVSDDINSKLNTEESHVVKENFVCEEAISNENFQKSSKSMNEMNITRRTKYSTSQLICDTEETFHFPEDLSNISLLQALDLCDISASFLNESIIQSNDSLLPLNLCCKDQDICTPIFKDESKENVPQSLSAKKKGFCTSSKRISPNKIYVNKTPKQLQKSPSFKDSNKKTGTKIPVRKIENFAVPVVTPSKQGKQVSAALSSEKVKKCHSSPHSASKKIPGTTPHKTPHFCKTRNTIFSKVPQIVPSKKYMNIESSIAKYIKNVHGSGKTPQLVPVLRDCMNQSPESPYNSHYTPKSGTLKSTKKKA